MLVVFTALSATAQQAPAYCNEKGIALKGYDVVAYFTDHAAVEGSRKFSYNWEGTEWHFKTQDHLDAFKANPQKYAPRFGGYCAYGASENHKAPTDPHAFTIISDTLYLNYNLKVKEMWVKDTDGYIKKAAKNWETLKDEN